MSSITLIKIRLKNVNEELLRQVVEQLCKEYNGKMTDMIKDYFGNVTKVQLGFICHAFPRGVGFDLQKGEVQIKGDFYMTQGSKEIEDKLIQTYTTQAYLSALRQQGFHTQTQKVGEKIYIRAFQW